MNWLYATRETLWGGGVVRVEASLSGTSAACSIFYSKCITRKYSTLKMKIKFTENSIHNSAIRWRISTSTCSCDSFHSFRDSYVSKISWPWNCRSSHDVQHSQCAVRGQILSDGNSNVCIFPAFICQNSKFDIENIDQGLGVQHSQMVDSMADIKLYNCHTWAFFANSHLLDIFTMQN